MEGLAQPLPGLLDDPLFQKKDLQGRSELHIAPLRNPLPTRTTGGPSPLEPKASRDLESTSSKVKLDSQQTPSSTRGKTPSITPATVILARDARKPITAISELLESTTTATSENTFVQLPSFVSLSAVEKTFMSPPSTTQDLRATKRLRLDPNIGNSDDYIHLPRPQQQHQGPRAPPLLPTIVKGIHEPPPNAALLPPMETNTQAGLNKGQTAGTTRPVPTNRRANAQPPEKMLNSPAMEVMEKLDEPEPSFDVEAVEERVVGLSLAPSAERQPKTRKAPRKWTDDETKHLFQGVVKHGLGKWKSILEDASFSFENRTAVDLKDRYRVCTSGPNKIRHVIEAQRAGEPLTPSSSSTINMRVGSKKTTDETEAHASSSSPPPEAPSTKRTAGRRVRRAWTSDEDENLLKGVVKHGFQWTAIHDDKELDLSHRKATDLRDRIRNKFPEGYRNAETAPPKSQIQKAASKGSHDDTGARATRKRKAPKNGSEGQKKEATKSSRLVEGADGYQEQPGRTLPPLDIDDEDWDWNNNTLPPLLDWEEMGI
jgi:hypothetical protein